MSSILDLYRKRVSSGGTKMGQILKKQSDMIMNETFTNDVNYKDALVKSEDNETGWKHEDIKWQLKTTQSESKDKVAYWVQFRPGVHHQIGEYIIIPDDTTEVPDIENMSHWWMIVDRDNATAFVRYLVLQCNWDYKWISEGVVYTCRGIIRDANNYTSGVWLDELSSSTDDLRAGIMPDNEISQTIHYDIRFMLSTNKRYPKVYRTTKIRELMPRGITKYSFKQDFKNNNADNFELGICDYYSSSIPPVDSNSPEKNGLCVIELAKGSTVNLKYNLGKKYLKATAYDIDGSPVDGISFNWSIKAQKNDYIFPDDVFITSVDENGYFIIQTNTDNLDIIGSVVTVTARDETYTYVGEFKLEVVSS